MAGYVIPIAPTIKNILAYIPFLTDTAIFIKNVRFGVVGTFTNTVVFSRLTASVVGMKDIRFFSLIPMLGT